ncbi:hypothetical protein C5B85_01380 [Pseudoclavibacter sp. AY1F1]|nr:hypothetical protein C5B85_01380 [Pseudoclavibacter sp. AY1F1]
MTNAAYGLQREGLIDRLSHGRGDYLRDEVKYTRGRELDENLGYVTFRLTGEGLSLLLQAVGCGQIWVGDVFGEKASLAVDQTRGLPTLTRPLVVSDLPLVTAL